MTLIVFGIYVYFNPPYNKSTEKVKVQSNDLVNNEEKKSKIKKICINYPLSEMPKMELGLIHKMTNDYKRYISNSNGLINRFGSVKKNDARAIWFDFKTLQKFLYFVEYYAEIQNTPIEDLGIRAYYANYPSKRHWNNYKDLSDGENEVPKKYEQMHTLIFIPTIKRGDFDFDFDPKNRKTYTRTIENVLGYDGVNRAGFFPAFQESVFNDTTEVFALSTRTTSRNHGSLFPPDPISAKGVSFPFRITAK